MQFLLSLLSGNGTLPPVTTQCLFHKRGFELLEHGKECNAGRNAAVVQNVGNPDSIIKDVQELEDVLAWVESPCYLS